MRINSLKCLLSIGKQVKLMLLSIEKNVVELIRAKLLHSTYRWVASLPEYHGVDTLPWIAFKAAYIRSDYSGLSLKRKFLTTKYSDQMAWERIVTEYAALTGAGNNIKDQYESLNRRREKLVRIDSLLILARYNEAYISELLAFTSQSTVKAALNYTKVIRAAFNDDLALYEQELKKYSENKTDPSESFFIAEYSVSKMMRFNVVSQLLTVKDMLMYIEVSKKEAIKEQKNG